MRISDWSSDVCSSDLGHVEGDVVALAHDVHAGALHLATQFGLLAVLVGADGATGQSANARTDQRALAAFGGVAAAEQARDHADAGADQRGIAGAVGIVRRAGLDRKSTRLNSSH